MKPKLIGIIGHARTGKDTIASRLEEKHGYTRFAFADPLRRLCEKFVDVPFMDKDIEPYSQAWRRRWEAFRTQAPEQYRRLLQEVGMSVRDVVDPGAWVRAFSNHIRSQPEDTLWVVPDVRQWNEAGYIQNNGGVLWSVERPGFEAVNDHRAEAMIDDLLSHCPCAARYTNGGDLAALKAFVDRVMEGPDD